MILTKCIKTAHSYCLLFLVHIIFTFFSRFCNQNQIQNPNHIYGIYVYNEQRLRFIIIIIKGHNFSGIVVDFDMNIVGSLQRSSPATNWPAVESVDSPPDPHLDERDEDELELPTEDSDDMEMIDIEDGELTSVSRIGGNRL